MSKTLYFVTKEFFYILSGAVFVFCGLEMIWPNIILAYLNINFVLLAWFFVAIILLINKIKY